MKLVYDDIIYSLQKSGGGSVYWTKVIQPSLESADHFVYDSAKDNIFYQQIKIKNETIIPSKYLYIKRLINPSYKYDTPFIFHSSYFRYCRNKNAINITTVHDFTSEKYVKGIHGLIHSMQLKATLHHSAGVICVSNNTKKDFEEYFPWYDGEVVAIQNGYDNSTYYFEPNTQKTKDVLFVGARTSYKRFDIAIKIVSSLTDCRLVIIGGGNLSDREIELLESSIYGRYQKIGFIDNDDLRHLYNRAFFLCYPSEYEGFGIPLLEAQACGCPVVCQCKSSIPEVANNTVLYIDSNSLSVSIDAIKTLYDETTYNQFIQNGLENVKNFSWEKCAKEHQRFYEKIWMKCADI